MLRVGFVLHAMPVAGAEVLTAETIRHLKDRIQPTIFCLDYIGTLGEALQAEGVEVVCLNRRSGRDWRLVGRLRRAIQQRRIQVLHAHQYTPFFYAACAKFGMLRHRPKLIFTEHGRHFPDIVSWKRRLFNRYVLSPVVDDINACCRFSADALRCNEGFTTRPVGVIFNGIDLRRYNPMPDRLAVRQTLGLDPQRRYVLTVARFHPVKDHATLLRALAVVTAQRPDVDLLLAGDGPLRPDLEQLAQSLNIRPHVHFLGVRSDVPILMQAADVFALTSVTEAASLTLMEAMASGLPVVVTNVGGNPELVQNGVDGLLVPRADPQATGEAILRVLSDPALAADLGRRARQRAEQQFLLDQTIAEYATLYEKLVGKSSY